MLYQDVGDYVLSQIPYLLSVTCHGILGENRGVVAGCLLFGFVSRVFLLLDRLPLKAREISLFNQQLQWSAEKWVINFSREITAEVNVTDLVSI